MSKTWAKCLNTLKDTLPLATFSVWVQPLKAIEDETNLSLLAPSTSVKNYINKNLKKEIKSVVAQHNKNLKIYIGVSSQSEKKVNKPKQHSTPLFPEYTFDNLVLGNANQMAYGATRQIAENIKSSPYNPFIIYGGSGLGKTHLMQAAGHLAKEKNPNIKIIYVPLMDFVRNITTSLRHNTIEDIKTYYQSADLLLVDDIHLIAGKEKSQEEFFHIFNFLFNIKKQIIFTCDQIPKNIESIENRLKTRFSAGLPVEIQPPELEMRAAILIYKASNIKINIKLGEEVALYIASNIKSNVRDLEGALLKLKAFIDFSGLSHKQVDKNLVDTALSDLISPKKTTVDIFDIQKETSIKYGITNSELISKSRKQNLVLARQTAIYLSCELTTLSLAKIGKNFGNKDHSTILYSYNKFKKIMDEKSIVKQIYENILLKLLTN